MSAIQTQTPLPSPLRTNTDGVIRVGGTRIPLDTIIREYQDGSTPEEIVASFDSLRLADVYWVITHYLGHKSEVDEYLAACRSAAADTRGRAESRPEYQQWRERLLARRTGRE